MNVLKEDCLVSPTCGGTFSWRIADDILVGDATIAFLFNLSAKEAGQGLPLARYMAAVNRDDRDALERKIAHAAETGAPYRASYRVTAADRSVVEVLAVGQCFRDANGTPSEYAGMVFDLCRASGISWNDNNLTACCVSALRAAERADNDIVRYLLSMALLELEKPATADRV